MKHLIVVGMIAALSIVATDARANSVTEFPAVIDGMSEFTAIHTDNDFGGSFTDHFTFNLSGDLLVSIFIKSDPFAQAGSTIDFSSADLNGVQLALFSEDLRFLSSTPFTGTLVLTVTGVTDAGTVVFADGSTSTSSYFGRLLTEVQPVPEPTSLILLGAGLVMLLGLSRKQLSRSH
jgi:hypothetical protein